MVNISKSSLTVLLISQGDTQLITSPDDSMVRQRQEASLTIISCSNMTSSTKWIKPGGDQLITPAVYITMCQGSVAPNTISDTKSCNIIKHQDKRRETDE